MTPAQRHMEKIAAMPCICCRLLGMKQTSKTDVHHIRAEREARNDFLTLPMCHHSCHQGPLGVHGTKHYLQMLKMSEWTLLAFVIEELEQQ